MNRMRTMLFCPASQPKMYIKAPIFKPDCILFDLEDAVEYSEKDSARDLLCKAVETLDFGEADICVRINSVQTDLWEEDVRAIVKAGIRFIRLSMCEEKKDVEKLDKFLQKVEKQEKIKPGTVKIQCSIETAKGVLNAREAIKVGNRVVSLSFGAEDYTRSLGTSRSKKGTELSYARTYLPLVAAEAGVSAVDTVWTDLNDEDGFEEEVKLARTLGFTGKSCIHPSQIKTVHKCFAPTEGEIIHAQKIIAAVNEMYKEGKGVFTVDGKMIDEPVITKAKRALMQAGESGETNEIY